MFASLIAKAKADSGRLMTSAPERSTLPKHHVSGTAEHGPMLQRTIGSQPMLARNHEQAADLAGLKPTSGPSWDFSKIPLFRSDRASRSPFPLTTVPSRPNIRPLDAYDSPSGVNAASRDENSPVPEETESVMPCGDRMRAVDAQKKSIHAKGTQPASAGMGISTHGQSKLNVSSAGDQFEQKADRVAKNECTASEGGPCSCPTCADGPIPVQDAHTYTFISRGSYGETTPNFTRPSCTTTVAGASILVAGSAAPAITVFPNGTYRVRRDDGVVQTATCTRLAAGLAATRAHEESHANGARTAATAANTAGGLPRNFATAAACSVAAPAILSTWNTSVDAAWANEVAHGPGTNPPTPQTFTQEHAAGNCTFA